MIACEKIKYSFFIETKNISGYWEDHILKECKECDFSCYTCSAGGPTNCIKCKANFFNKDNLCVLDCGFKMYGDLTTGNCE